MVCDKKWKTSDIETCTDYSILKDKLLTDELKYAAYLCELHENALPDEQGKYICGCQNPDDDGYGNNYCNTGLWLESCYDTDDFIDFIKDSYARGGFFSVKDRIEEEDLEELLLAGGWNIYDDIADRVIDSCKVSDIAHDNGFVIEDTEAENGYVFTKQTNH